MRILTFLALLSFLCGNLYAQDLFTEDVIESQGVSLVVLGTIQDAGSPHIGCKKDCCKDLFMSPDPGRKVVSLGIIDYKNRKTFLIEATPDMSVQLKNLKQVSGIDKELPDGIFLTHAHIGHYSGLMYLGREATNATEVPVYVLSRMKSFLETNGPWNQLVEIENIALREMNEKKELKITDQISITPFLVPHRDEYSETVGFSIKGPSKKAIFIPDIDKWQKWESSIAEIIETVDYAFIDATFYSGDEINTRDISEIPHPFIVESMELFENLPASEKNKIHFIHFNHTNPVLDPNSEAYKRVIEKGYHIAQINNVIKL